MEIASFNAFYIFTTNFAKQRYNVSQFADGRNHTLAFSISSTAQSATQFYLDTVSIYPLYNNLLGLYIFPFALLFLINLAFYFCVAQTVYVSNSGNDLLGTGSSSSPCTFFFRSSHLLLSCFCTVSLCMFLIGLVCSVKVGLESIAPSSILRIQTGTYCDHALEIPRV